MEQMIARALKEYFGAQSRCYHDEAEQGAQFPCFFIALKEIEKKRMLGKRTLNRYCYEITFYPEKKERKFLENTSEALFSCLGAVRAEDGWHLGKNMKSTLQEDKVLFFVTYDTFTYEEETTNLMESLWIKA